MEIALRVHVVQHILLNISRYTGPIFAIFSPYERYVQMMDLYLIFQFVNERCHGNQNNVERNENVMKAD